MGSTTDRVNSLLGQVRSYTVLDLHVVPIHGMENGQCTCGDENCDRPGKHPLLPRGVFSASVDYDWLESIFRAFPNSNLGIATGRISGILLLDLDTQEAIDLARKQGLPKTWAFRTGKGEQYAFRYPKIGEDYRIQNAVQLAPGMDIRSDGGYSVVPESTHYTGKIYTWIHPPETTELVDVPKWLMDKLIVKDTTASNTYKPEDEAEIITQGGRNEYLFKIGTQMRAARFVSEEIRLVLQERNMRSCDPPLSESEVNNVVESIVTHYPPGIDDSIEKEVEEHLGPIDQLPKLMLEAPLTDSGNAECLAELFHADYRSTKTMVKYKTDSKGLFHWNGKIWEEDVHRSFRDRAKWISRGRRQVSKNAETVEARRKLYQFAMLSENKRKLEDMCDLASTDDRISKNADTWDSNPLILMVNNGIINLETGTFTEPKREDYITKIAPVVYDDLAECPIWEATLKEIFSDNLDIIPYIQRVFGYCLTGMTEMQTMWFWYGGGSNGKSTILNALKALLGDGQYSATTNFSTFDTRNDNGRNDGLAELRGARFVTASEGEQGRSVAEAKIKQVLSTDGITCRFLHNNFFTYYPTFKMILASNHLPRIQGTDRGIWRRVHIVPFNQSFEGREDFHLEEKLKAEHSGILNWCLAGLADFWSKGGFDPPQIVLYSTKNLESQSDNFQQWFDERVTPQSGSTMRRSPAYLDYRNYIRTSGEPPISKMEWTNRMKSLGVLFNQKVRGDLAAAGWRMDSETY